ncbi:MAG TPA: cation-efflux pump [Acidobacteriota bacterium]|nr:cation-efflux pump [Acidobacteriota bacterium]
MSSGETLEATAGEKEKKSAAAKSVVAAVFLTGMKLVVGLVTGSLGILAEAAHSALDLVAAVVTFLAVHFSDRPADHEHPYGHGKIENFSALVETFLLFGTCAWIIYEAVRRLFFHTREVNASLWGFVVMAVSIAVDISRSRMLYRAARKHNSQALEADALHFHTDIWSSSVVIGGLALVWLGQNVFPGAEKVLVRADAVAALGVAVIVLFVSYRLGKRTIDVLLDTAPDGMTQKITEAAGETEGVMSVGHVRVRRSGPRVFVDLTVEVDRNLSFELTHTISDAVESRIMQISPGADVVIHTDPREGERETIARRIRAVAERNQMAVHNISVHEDRGQLTVDLHMEVDDHLSLQQAHEMASHIERDLRADQPRISRINTHIESRGTGVGEGQDVTARETRLVATVRKIADEIVGGPSCHEVHVRRLGMKYVIAIHCTFDERLSIVQVHELSSRIEERLKSTVPAVDHVLVHAEPEGK